MKVVRHTKIYAMCHINRIKGGKNTPSSQLMQEKNPTKLNFPDKNTKKTGNRIELPQLDKEHLQKPQSSHHSQWQETKLSC